MALLWADSFDDRRGYLEGALTALQERYERYGANTAAFWSQTGRTGNGLTFAPSNVSAWIEKFIPASQTVITGFAFKIGGTPAASAEQVWGLLDGGSYQIYAEVNTDWTVTFRRGDGTALATTAANQTVSASAYQYWQIKAKIDATGGTLTVRVDGVDIITLSGINTKQTANSSANVMHLGASGGVSAYYMYFDDLYICDDQGGVNDDFLGAVKIACLLPDSAGTASQWTPNTGANWQCVDDTTPDDDTTYVYTDSVGARDLYNLGALAITGDVLGVAINARARKDALAPRQFQTVLRHGATDSNLTTSDLTDAYKGYQWQLQENPVTDAAWTTTDLNNLQIGVRCSQ